MDLENKEYNIEEATFSKPLPPEEPKSNSKLQVLIWILGIVALIGAGVFAYSYTKGSVEKFDSPKNLATSIVDTVNSDDGVFGLLNDNFIDHQDLSLFMYNDQVPDKIRNTVTYQKLQALKDDKKSEETLKLIKDNLKIKLSDVKTNVTVKGDYAAVNVTGDVEYKLNNADKVMEAIKEQATVNTAAYLMAQDLTSLEEGDKTTFSDVTFIAVKGVDDSWRVSPILSFSAGIEGVAAGEAEDVNKMLTRFNDVEKMATAETPVEAVQSLPDVQKSFNLRLAQAIPNFTENSLKITYAGDAVKGDFVPLNGFIAEHEGDTVKIQENKIDFDTNGATLDSFDLGSVYKDPADIGFFTERTDKGYRVDVVSTLVNLLMADVTEDTTKAGKELLTQYGVDGLSDKEVDALSGPAGIAAKVLEAFNNQAAASNFEVDGINEGDFNNEESLELVEKTE